MVRVSLVVVVAEFSKTASMRRIPHLVIISSLVIPHFTIFTGKP